MPGCFDDNTAIGDCRERRDEGLGYGGHPSKLSGLDNFG